VPDEEDPAIGIERRRPDAEGHAAPKAGQEKVRPYRQCVKIAFQIADITSL
jgi:hypothetical protein